MTVEELKAELEQFNTDNTINDKIKRLCIMCYQYGYNQGIKDFLTGSTCIGPPIE